MLHFAYGANMHRVIMRRHAPAAVPIGVAELPNHRFCITADGYASIAPEHARKVHGVVWRVTPRDRAALDAWENVAGGLYRCETVAVDTATGRRHALAYIARRRPSGPPKRGYMEIVVKAARGWEFPEDYIADLEEWLPGGQARGAVHRKLGDFV